MEYKLTSSHHNQSKSNSKSSSYYRHRETFSSISSKSDTSVRKLGLTNGTSGVVPLFKGPDGLHISSVELHKIKVDIHRNIPAKESVTEVQRDILNPEDVILKRRSGEGCKPIFEREKIKKAVEVEERRTVMAIKDIAQPSLNIKLGEKNTSTVRNDRQNDTEKYKDKYTVRDIRRHDNHSYSRERNLRSSHSRSIVKKFYQYRDRSNDRSRERRDRERDRDRDRDRIREREGDRDRNRDRDRDRDDDRNRERSRKRKTTVLHYIEHVPEMKYTDRDIRRHDNHSYSRERNLRSSHSRSIVKNFYRYRDRSNERSRERRDRERDRDRDRDRIREKEGDRDRNRDRDRDRDDDRNRERSRKRKTTVAMKQLHVTMPIYNDNFPAEPVMVNPMITISQISSLRIAQHPLLMASVRPFPPRLLRKSPFNVSRFQFLKHPIALPLNHSHGFQSYGNYLLSHSK